MSTCSVGVTYSYQRVKYGTHMGSWTFPVTVEARLHFLLVENS